MREILDATDRRLSKLLSVDAQRSVNQLADTLQLSAPTVRARLRTLIKNNTLKVVGMLNLAERPELIGAIVGISGDIQDLYRFTSEQLSRVAEPGVVSRSETFVVMKSRNKWVSLARGCWE